MKRKWILIADRSKARFFEYQGPNKPFKLIHKIEHPEGKIKGREISSDKHGESFDRMGYGRHKMENSFDPREEENKKFASEICDYLKTAKNEQKFDSAIIVSGPAFLGYLKEKMDNGLMKSITNWIPKNLGQFDDKEIHEHFSEYLNV